RRAFLTPALQFLLDLHIAVVSAANIKPLALPPLAGGSERRIQSGNDLIRKRNGLSHCAARHVRECARTEPLLDLVSLSRRAPCLLWPLQKITRLAFGLFCKKITGHAGLRQERIQL